MVAAPMPGSDTRLTPSPSFNESPKRKSSAARGAHEAAGNRGTMKVGASKSFSRSDKRRSLLFRQGVRGRTPFDRSLGRTWRTAPYDRARVHAEIMNRSRLKIRNLRAAVLIGNIRTGRRKRADSDDGPGEHPARREGEHDLYLSCGLSAHARGVSRQWSSNDIIVLLATSQVGPNRWPGPTRRSLSRSPRAEARRVTRLITLPGAPAVRGNRRAGLGRFGTVPQRLCRSERSEAPLVVERDDVRRDLERVARPDRDARRPFRASEPIRSSTP